MKLITWNCRMAFEKKWSLVAGHAPDLLIVQECARPQLLRAAGVPIELSQSCWASRFKGGDRKGLGVFAFNGWEIRLAPMFETLQQRWQDRLDIILPIEVITPHRLNLLAVWSFNNRERKDMNKIEGPVLVALSELQDWINEAPTLVCGDFNHNVIWDKKHHKNNFATMVERLEALGLRSIYHAVRDEAFGAETVPTHYWRDVREDGLRYHIDYCFVPEHWIAQGATINVGSFADWCGPGKSDHAPLTLISSVSNILD